MGSRIPRRLAGAGCPQSHPLARGLGMGGCGPLEVAVLVHAKDLARRLARAGCAHTLATAVQAGDVEWIEAQWTEADKRRAVCAHFRGGRAPEEALVQSYTPLIAAVVARDLPLVECLIRLGADVFQERWGHRSTPINYAQVQVTVQPQGPHTFEGTLNESVRRAHSLPFAAADRADPSIKPTSFTPQIRTLQPESGGNFRGKLQRSI